MTDSFAVASHVAQAAMQATPEVARSLSNVAHTASIFFMDHTSSLDTYLVLTDTALVYGSNEEN